MIVCLRFAVYVNENIEQLRSLFVEHQDGKLNMNTLKYKKMEFNIIQNFSI